MYVNAYDEGAAVACALHSLLPILILSFMLCLLHISVTYISAESTNFANQL